MTLSMTRSALLAAVLLSALAGCAVDTANGELQDGHEAAGSIELALTWGDRNFSVVEYRIETQAGELYFDGVIDISESEFFVSKYIDGVAPGRYVLLLNAVSDDGARTCRGRDEFTVVARETAQLSTLIVCGPTRNSGAISIRAQFDDCTGGIDRVEVEPALARVGETMSLVVHPGGGFGPITWTASSGTIDFPGSPEATYTCTEIGIHTITVSVGSDNPLCDLDTRELTVECMGGP